MPGDGALAFPLDPEISPTDEPAHWSPQILGTTIIYSEAAGSKQPIQHDSWNAVHCQHCADGRHFVVQIGAVRFRLWQPNGRLNQRAAFLIPDDHLTHLRSEANWHYLKALRSSQQPGAFNRFAPTSYQRRRLTLLLAIADARGAGASVREIAFSLVFPRTQILSGATWKGANEKRQTLRLIGHAKTRIAESYLQLPGFSVAQLTG